MCCIEHTVWEIVTKISKTVPSQFNTFVGNWNEEAEKTTRWG